MTDERDEDYEVGYRKPPKETQWKPGQSGNPNGRPKKIKEFDKLFERELSETLRFEEGGQMRILSKRELIIKTTVNTALKGDRGALKLVLGLMKSQQSIEGFEPDAEDRAALMALLEKAKLEDEASEEASDG